jgi:hypothetical protein
MKKIVLLFILLIAANISAQTTRPDDAIDLSKGKIYIKDGGYSVGSSSAETIEHTGAYNIYSTDTASNYFKLDTDAGAQEINLWNLNVSISSGFMYTYSGADLILNAIGNNEAVTSLSNGGSFMLSIKNEAASTLTINGDSLSLYCNYTVDPKMIGSKSYNLDKVDLVLNLEYLNLRAVVGDGVAVGSSMSSQSFKSLKINDDCVFSANGNIYAESIIIGKASVKVNSMSVVPVNNAGDNVYCVTVPRNGVNTVTVKNTEANSEAEYTFTSAHEGDDNYYLYLPNGSYAFTTNGTTYKAVVDGVDVVATLPALEGDGVIDVSSGKAIVISEGGYQVGSQTYTYSGDIYTFSGTATSGGVTLNGGVGTIYLNGVDIELDGSCALNVSTGTNIEVVLKEGTTNTLVSGSGYAGLQKGQTDGILTIKGTGFLKATGGSKAAGIGSAYGQNCSGITIQSGVITATGGERAAAFGAGDDASAGNLLIKGGILNLRNYNNSAVIGCSSVAANPNIVISGGLVNLSAGNDLNVGISKVLPDNIQISGGTVTARILSGSAGTLLGTGTIITGGSVNLKEETLKLSTSIRPVNEDSENVYRSRFQVPEISEMTKITSITINGIPWNCTDVYTDSNGWVYLWLPVSEGSNTVVISTGSSSYTYEGKIVAYDNYVAPDKELDIWEYGNYWCQVYISLSGSENGTLSVTDDNVAVANGSWLCNNTGLLISAVPDDGYNLASLTVNDEPVSNNSTYVVTENVEIEAFFEVPTTINDTPEMYNVYSKDGNIYVEIPGNMQVVVYKLSGQMMFETTSSGSVQCFNVGKTGLYFVKIFDVSIAKTVKCIVKF